jgi:Fe-S-cluster-containing dehydrogenase component
MAVQIMMLIDTSKCIGCKACQIACQQWHQLPAEDTQFTGSYTNPPDRSGANHNVVKFFEHGNNGNLRFLFFPDRCRHCHPPYCKEACPLNAIKVTANGLVVIHHGICDTRLCNRECEIACPYKTGFPPKGIPRFEYTKDSVVHEPKGTKDPPQPVGMKCDFCYDRFKNLTLQGAVLDAPDPQTGGRYRGAFGRPSGDPPFSHRPACELVCPTGAIRTHLVSTVRQYATNRMNFVKANGYPNANLYPPLEVESHMVWLLLEDPSAYDLTGWS